MTSRLRDYQEECLEAIKANIDRNIVACLPTGSGKSFILAELCRWAIADYPGSRVIVLAHVRELLEQNADKLRQHWPEAPIGMYCAGLRQKNIDAITIASIQSIYRKTPEVGHYDLILVDECHRIPLDAETMYRRFLDEQRQLYEHVKIIGLTATPYRMKSGLLHDGDDALFDDLVYNATFGELVDKGWLAPIVPIRGSLEADTSKLHVIAGEFRADEMEVLFSADEITTAVVSDIILHAADRQSILVFSSGVDHAELIRAEFQVRGIPADVITGETHSDDRSDSIVRFKARQLRVLINCNVLTTGFDAECIDCIALVRATKSPGLYVQILGRGSRTYPGKINGCLILDYGQNVRRHGPIDEVLGRITRKETNGDGKPLTKTCSTCGMECSLSAKVCPNCGFVFPKTNVETRTDDADPMGEKPRTMAVNRVTAMRHTKPNKPDMVRVIYWLAGDTLRDRIQVSEFLCFDHSDGARWHARRWVRKNVRRDDACDMWAYDTVDGMCEIGHRHIVSPVTVRIAKQDKYWRIIDKEFRHVNG